MRPIGDIDLFDLDFVCRQAGREMLPFPLMLTGPSRFATHAEYLAHCREIPDRLRDGDLAELAPVLENFVNADIRVECNTHRLTHDRSVVRVLAFRRGSWGYLATQGETSVEVCSLSPFELGRAVADAAGLTGAGEQERIVVPEFASVAGADDVTSVTEQHRLARRGPTAVARADLAAFGTVQTHWRPTRQWGVDPGKRVIVWINAADDGDYLFEPQLRSATPVTAGQLAAAIDTSISADAKALREFRAT